ncbi:MAG: molybdate ABC transporter substrate-binding protein [Cyanobacteria bacterium P01_E01_bin.34]
MAPRKRRQWLRRQFCMGIAGAIIASVLALGPDYSSMSTTVDMASARTTTITVSAAASLQNALEAIAPKFQTLHADIAVNFNFASSGALQRQLEQGAPADVFFSASPVQMDALEEQGTIVPTSRQDLVSNSIVLIAPKTSTLEISDLSQLADISVNRFAVGDFRSVPAGQYAEQVLAQFELLEVLQPAFVFGNTVRNSLAAVASGNADLGMVYGTDAALSDGVKVLVIAPAGSHEPIAYPIAAIEDSPNPDAAQAFIDFLATDSAQEIFADFGFDPISVNE